VVGEEKKAPEKDVKRDQDGCVDGERSIRKGVCEQVIYANADQKAYQLHLA
jgi:hypothetical protein